MRLELLSHEFSSLPPSVLVPSTTDIVVRWGT